jgi:hypothetical protein
MDKQRNTPLIHMDCPIPEIKDKNVDMTSNLDTLSEKLGSKGYIVENRIYDNSSLCYLLAKTRLGDLVLIRVDSFQFSLPGMINDIQLDNRSSAIVVPHETKMGTLQCIEHGVCGAAYVCKDNICVTQRKGLDPMGNFSEETFSFKNGINEFVGNPIVPFPVISLSEILNNPIKREIKIAKASDAIAKVSFIRLRSYSQDFEDAVKRLIDQSNNIKRAINDNEKIISNNIHQMTQLYENIREIDSENDKVTYYDIQKILAELKDFRINFLDSTAAELKHKTEIILK